MAARGSSTELLVRTRLVLDGAGPAGGEVKVLPPGSCLSEWRRRVVAKFAATDSQELG